MANIKTTPSEWAAAQKYFEAGLILVDISKKTGISRTSLSEKSKKEGWKRKNLDTAPLNLPAEIGKQIKTMAGYGLMDYEIAAVLGIELEQLQLNFSKELVTANPEMVARVAQSMFRMATDANKPNVTAGIFWLKCRGGWNDDPANAKLGKKQERHAAAGNAIRGKYAPSAPPKLVAVNNSK